jgi:Ca2+-binding RTX toxin-like protein
MTVISDVETYDSMGNLTYRNYATLTDGRYHVVIDALHDDLPPVPTGDGDDTIDIAMGGDLTTPLSLGGGNDHLNLVSGSGDRYAGTVHGGDGDDVISGHNIGFLYGDGGNDTLYAGGWVYGGTGDDNVRSDTYAYGGSGNDIVSGVKSAYGDGGNDHVTSAGAAFGDDGDDYVSGDLYADGGAGNDEVHSIRGQADGGAGDDIVVGYDAAIGGAGNDIVSVTSRGSDNELYGNDGNDRLYGGPGNDLLVGGAGRDILTGGGGQDVFRFDQGDLGLSQSTRDVIKDFQVGQDKIDLKAYADASIRILHGDGYDRVAIDVGHDHKTDFLIQVHVMGGSQLTMADIITA